MSETAPPNSRAPDAWRATIERWGGVLLHPRDTLAALAPEVGRRDGRWLVLLFVVGTQLLPFGLALKSLLATGGLGGGIAFASAIVRTLLGPIIVVVLAEFALGAQRSYRSGTYLVPLVAVAVTASLLRLAGVANIGSMSVVAVGAAWSLGVVFYTKAAVNPEPLVGKGDPKVSAKGGDA